MTPPLTILGYTIEEARDYQRFWRNAASQAVRYGDIEQAGRDWRCAERFYDEAEEALAHAATLSRKGLLECKAGR